MKSKIVKLPLFLGIVVAVCGAILAGVYSFTNPIIQKAQQEKAFAAYISMYSKFNATADDFKISEDVDDIGGCSAMAIIETSSCKGICYTMSAKGFGGDIKFQVAFANGEYLSYTDLTNSETSSYGGYVIANIAKTIAGIKSDTRLLEDSGYGALISGKSVTGKALANAIENCRVHYNAWYASK